MSNAKPLPPEKATGAQGADAADGGSAPAETGAARIAEALRRAIVRCELSPGDRLSETEVSRQFGVSRQPVREAFIRLSVAGLVEARARSGTRVLPVDEAVIRTARFVREAVEVQVVRALVAKGLDAPVHAELDRLITAQESAPDASAFLDLDEAFHRILAEAVGMGEAYAMIDAVKAQMDRVRYLSMAELHQRRLCAQHRAIVDAIAASDEPAAAEAMRGHLTEILRSLPAIVERYPALFAGHSRPQHRPPHRSGRNS